MSQLKNVTKIIIEECQKCGKSSLVTDIETGELICRGCGLVLTEKMEDSSHEWRNFENEEDRARAGAGTSLARHDMGLYTIINAKNRDATGKPLPVSMKRDMRRLRFWDNRSQAKNSKALNYLHAFNDLSKLKDKLAISDATVEKAAYIYRKAMAKGLVRGRSISALIAAALYAACKDTETLRSIDEIEEASNVKRKRIIRCYSQLLQELDLQIPVVDSVKCIAKIASKLGISEKTKRFAMMILRKYEKIGGTAGKSPMGLAATSLYLACVKMGDDCTQKAIARAANITPVTIRSRSPAIKKILNMDKYSTLI